MEQAWRWFGPKDPVNLSAARQAGATGIVSALHDNYMGERWTPDEVLRHKAIIEAAGLRWSVVESIPVHNDIKTRSEDWRAYIDKYKDSISVVASAGISKICYNFLPLVDWVRTDLRHRMPSGALALRFDMLDFIVCDVFLLERANASESYTSDLAAAAAARHEHMSGEQKSALLSNVIAGLPGGTTSYGPKEFLREYDRYRELTKEDLRSNLVSFLQEVVPHAEEVGVKLCIHPDDPPIDLFGLPRVTSTTEDLQSIFKSVPSMACGLTLCVGSLAVRRANDVPAMAKLFADRIHFAHLRNVRTEEDGSFHESDHLDGSADMTAVVEVLLREELRRLESGEEFWQISIRPDHGHLLLGDQDLHGVNPGYSAIGRLRGLAELRGVIAGLTYARQNASSIGL